VKNVSKKMNYVIFSRKNLYPFAMMVLNLLGECTLLRYILFSCLSPVFILFLVYFVVSDENLVYLVSLY
jgi:hypothetical protein